MSNNSSIIFSFFFFYSTITDVKWTIQSFLSIQGPRGLFKKKKCLTNHGPWSKELPVKISKVILLLATFFNLFESHEEIIDFFLEETKSYHNEEHEFIFEIFFFFYKEFFKIKIIFKHHHNESVDPYTLYFILFLSFFSDK